jgi:para-aminobenzoate synthetase/4-amino-4-deoxychorismate lyase
VEVDKLFDVETYPTVHQLVSTITARKREGVRMTDILRALFPCGSVTGAPKIRAMEVIRALEQSPRGIYCGAIGAFSPDGSASFNVAIRTLTIDGNRGQLGIGGGVVYDSTSGREYEEALLKARYFEAARKPMSLIETLRWSPAEGFVRLEHHLARMATSAAAFGLAFDDAAVRRRTLNAVAGASVPMRVRATLSDMGEVAASAVPLEPVHAARWTYLIASERVDSADLLLRHKTSRREMYDAGQAQAAQSGADEMLFVNERDEITEGCRTNVFAEIDGRLLTPPVSCGLLDGCLRRELLDEGRCAEAVLTQADLIRADRILLGNSLRGLIPAIRAQVELPAA